jgi:hypothetical protein
MNDDLIDWKQDLPSKNETWDDILGSENESETHAYNVAVQKAQDEKTALRKSAEQLSDSELLDQWGKAAKKLEAANLEQRQVDAALRFVAATPELVLNAKAMSRIDAYFKVAKLDASDPSHFDQAYRALAARKLVDIDESKRVREPFQRYTQEDLETMPIEQLRELAEAQARK